MFDPKRKAIKKIGLFTLVLITVNSILGSGIFALPGKIFQQMAGNFWIAILISTIMAVLLSIVFSYAAKFIQKSGGAYIYCKEAFGNWIGSIVGIMKVFTTVLVNATLITISVSQLSKYIVSLGGWDISYKSSYFWIGWIIIVVVLMIYTTIISMGGKSSGLFTNVITIAKLIPIIIIIFIGMAYIGKHAENFSDSSPGKISKGTFVSGNKMSGIIGGILTLFYAYLGFDSLANSAEAYKNPKKNIPIALMITIAFLVFVYTILMIISIGSLDKSILQNPSKSVIAEVARHTFMGNFGFHLVMIGSLISMFGITFMALFYTPFIFSRTAKDGLLPNVLRLRNKNGAYYISIYVALVLTILLSFSGTWNFLLQLNVLSRFTQFIPTCIAIMIFKKRYREKVKTTIMLEISAIVSIIILAFLIIIQFIPLDGVNAGYEKTLVKMAWSTGFLVVAILIGTFYSRYNMDLKDKNDKYQIFIKSTGLAFKIKTILLWTFVPIFMIKRGKDNFKKVYEIDKTTLSDKLENTSVKLIPKVSKEIVSAHLFEKMNPYLLKTIEDKSDWKYMNPNSFLLGTNIKRSGSTIAKFVKKENANILSLNIEKVTKKIVEEINKAFSKNKKVKLDKIYHFIFDYAKNECEFYINYSIEEKNGKIYKYTSLYNHVKIEDEY